MNFPLISEYIESIRFAEENFDKLKALRPALDDSGNPIMSSGNYAVVFKMQDSSTGELFAIKCFTKEEPQREENYIKIASELQFVDSPYILKVEYLQKELFVHSSHSEESEFPVLKMPWVEGKTLGAYISDNYDNSFIISQLAYNFCKLGQWLLPQDFAHGDLKPDNIIIRQNGMPVLVDYDGMYVPSMKGASPQEIGSPGFRHPSRIEGTFNEHIDDFAIAVIALSLCVLSKDLSAFYSLKANDFSLFSEEDFTDLAQTEGIKHILKTIEDNNVKKLWGLLLLVLSETDLSSVSFRLLSIPLPSLEEDYLSKCSLSAEEEKLISSVINCGEGYLLDKSGKRLLNYQPRKDSIVPEGIEIICSRSMQGHGGVPTRKHITLPESLKAIGAIAFANNESIDTFTIPHGVEFIEPNNPFGGCMSLSDIQVLSPKFIISGHCLYNSDYSILYSSLFGVEDDVLIIHPNTRIIAANAFWGQLYKRIVLPEGLQKIGYAAFKNCAALEEIKLPTSLEVIENEAFSKCESLREIHLPNMLKRIGSMAFHKCTALTSLEIPSSVDYIGLSVFCGCESLKRVYIPNTIKTFGSKHNLNSESFVNEGYGGSRDFISYKYGGMFCECKSLEFVHLPSSTRIISLRDFRMCESIKHIVIPEGVETIEKGAFSGCIALEQIMLPSSLRVIGERCFNNCTSLKSIIVPEGVETIEREAFYNCADLEHITLPSTLREIPRRCFSGCTSLKTFKVPEGVESLDFPFSNCTSLETIELPRTLQTIKGALNRVFWHCPLKLIINHSSVKLESLITSYPEMCIKYDNDINE